MSHVIPAIERLHAVGPPRGLARGIPLIIFGIGHWTGGVLTTAIALVLGAIRARRMRDA